MEPEGLSFEVIESALSGFEWVWDPCLWFLRCQAAGCCFQALWCFFLVVRSIIGMCSGIAGFCRARFSARSVCLGLFSCYRLLFLCVLLGSASAVWFEGPVLVLCGWPRS